MLQQFGFYRPYGSWRGGVQPEPWHLSYAPLSGPALQQLQWPMLAEALQSVDLAEGAWVQQHLPELFACYVSNVDPVPLAP